MAAPLTLVTAGASVSVLLGRGDGTFATRVDYGRTGYSATLGDLNGDGALDLVTTTSVFLGRGDGTFFGICLEWGDG